MDHFPLEIYWLATPSAATIIKICIHIQTIKTIINLKTKKP